MSGQPSIEGLRTHTHGLRLNNSAPSLACVPPCLYRGFPFGLGVTLPFSRTVFFPTKRYWRHELGLPTPSEVLEAPATQSSLDQSLPGLLHALLCTTMPNVSVLKRFALAETTTVATTLARMRISSDAKSRCSILPPESNWFEDAARTLKH